MGVGALKKQHDEYLDQIRVASHISQNLSDRQQRMETAGFEHCEEVIAEWPELHSYRYTCTCTCNTSSVSMSSRATCM